jgi:hypothetical protein
LVWVSKEPSVSKSGFGGSSWWSGGFVEKKKEGGCGGYVLLLYTKARDENNGQ